MNPTGRVTIAAFDVDGTLTTHDCVVPFLRRMGGTGALARKLAVRAPRLAAAAARRRRDVIKAIAVDAALRDVDHDRVETEAAAFAASVVAHRLRPDTVARLRWHLDQDHVVVLVSASLEVYLRHLAAHLGASEVLGTRLEVRDGRCTGALDGRNCRGAEKVRRLHEWLDRHHGGRGAVEVWAYGDSAGDDELLADADHSVRVTGRLTSVSPRDERT